MSQKVDISQIHAIRIAIFGDPGVGKTSLGIAMATGRFPTPNHLKDVYLETLVSIDPYYNSINYTLDDKFIQLFFWDSSQQSLQSLDSDTTDPTTSSSPSTNDSEDIPGLSLKDFQKSLPSVSVKSSITPIPSANEYINNGLALAPKSFRLPNGELSEPVDVILICFDVTEPRTFASAIHSWSKVAQTRFPEIPIVLVGTKIDKINTVIAQEKMKQRNKIFEKIMPNQTQPEIPSFPTLDNITNPFTKSSYNQSPSSSSSQPDSNTIPSFDISKFIPAELTRTERIISPSDGKIAARTIGAVGYFECSSLYSCATVRNYQSYHSFVLSLLRSKKYTGDESQIDPLPPTSVSTLLDFAIRVAFSYSSHCNTSQIDCNLL